VKYLLLFASLPLFALTANAGPCLPGTLQDYINLSPLGCTLSNVQFTDFFLAPGQSIATPIDPAQIQVTPGGPLFSPTLLLSFNRSASAGQLLESFFHFRSTASPLLSAGISLGSPRVTGDGAITGILDVCANGQFLGTAPIGCTGTPDTAIAFMTSSDSSLSDGTPFRVSSFFDVFVDLSIDGGLAGSAFLGTASVSVTTPEPPPQLLLLTLSLASLGTRKLRRWRRH
jgi:hypothetical protein